MEVPSVGNIFNRWNYFDAVRPSFAELLHSSLVLTIAISVMKLHGVRDPVLDEFLECTRCVRRSQV